MTYDLAGEGVKYRPLDHSTDHYPLRFIVARDPFSRLASAYLDKTYLPDFWLTEMRPLMLKNRLRNNTSHHSTEKQTEVELDQDFLRDHLETVHWKFGHLTKLTSGVSSTREDSQCGKYVTFAEFVYLTLQFYFSRV